MSALQLMDKPSGCLLGYASSWGPSTRWLTSHTCNKLVDTLIIVYVSYMFHGSIEYLLLWKCFTVRRFLVLYQVMQTRAVALSYHRPRFCGSAQHHDVGARGLCGLVGTGGLLYTTFLYCRRHFGEQSSVTIHMFVVRVAGIGGYTEVHSTMSNGTNGPVNTRCWSCWK